MKNEAKFPLNCPICGKWAFRSVLIEPVTGHGDVLAAERVYVCHKHLLHLNSIPADRRWEEYTRLMDHVPYVNMDYVHPPDEEEERERRERMMNEKPKFIIMRMEIRSPQPPPMKFSDAFYRDGNWSRDDEKDGES